MRRGRNELLNGIHNSKVKERARDFWLRALNATMEDQTVRYSTVPLVMGADPVLVAAESSNRLALVLAGAPDNPQSMEVAPVPGFAQFAGLTIDGSFAGEFFLVHSTHGKLVQVAWWCRADLAPGTCVVIELFAGPPGPLPT